MFLLLLSVVPEKGYENRDRGAVEEAGIAVKNKFCFVLAVLVVPFKQPLLCLTVRLRVVLRLGSWL